MFLMIRTMSTSNAPKITNYGEPWPFSDITLDVEKRPIYANKVILSLWSPVFEAMFRNNFREKEAAKVDLPGKAYKDVYELIAVTHPPNKEITGLDFGF